ncbi:helix-turn-helix domain-containing protein [Actinoplanes sp. GCM10030250]|uniref:helix-turn-helix domain-containing protein n=1 Tax=Actinoplanes sp. GCM10030250 TaxID=3273376 RepID=UPI0036105218
MPVLTHATTPASAPIQPDRAAIRSCPLPVAAGNPTTLLESHALVLTIAGPLHAEIDFATHTCEPGTLLWLRPGQAVHFSATSSADMAGLSGKRNGTGTGSRSATGTDPALTITFRPGLFAPDELPGLAPDDPSGPARAPLPLADPPVFRATFEHLARDADGPPGPAAAALLRHELAALLLRIAMLDPETPETAHVEGRTFERFRRRLEDGYPHTRRVEDYAAELGCSVRTLTRASLALTGRTAKQVVDDRVALQARRLLAATPLSVAEVGRSLGFGEPTNFGRFFHRETGLSPGQFRARYAADRPSGIPGQRSPAD